MLNLKGTPLLVKISLVKGSPEQKGQGENEEENKTMTF